MSYTSGSLSLSLTKLRSAGFIYTLIIHLRKRWMLQWDSKGGLDYNINPPIFLFRKRLSSKAARPDGSQIRVVPTFFWKTQDIMVFMKEFHWRGRLSKQLGASSIALIPKKSGAENIKDLRSTSLIGSIYKILAKVLTSRLQEVLPCPISFTQGAFAHGRQILDGVLIEKECIRSRLERRPNLLCKLNLEKAYNIWASAQRGKDGF